MTLHEMLNNHEVTRGTLHCMRGISLKECIITLRNQIGSSHATKRLVREPSTLEHAPVELQGDREIVLAAVSRDGATLRCAALELRGDPEIVQTAVQSDWKPFATSQRRFEGMRL